MSGGDGTALNVYPDTDKTDALALDAMRLAAANGLLTDGRVQTTLHPTDAVLRAEIATVLMQYLTGIAK